MPSFSRPLEETLHRAVHYANERRHEYATLEHLCDLGFGHFVGEDAADPDAMLVHVQHDAGRVLAALLEEPLQHVDDELHWSVVVIQDQHPIKRGPLKFRLCLGDDGGACASALFTWPSVRHSWSVVGECQKIR